MRTFRCFKCENDGGPCTLTLDETCNDPERCPFPDSGGKWDAEWVEDAEPRDAVALSRREVRMICAGLSWQIAIAASSPSPSNPERQAMIRAWGELRDRIRPDGWRVRCRKCGNYSQQTTNAPTRCGACGSTDVEVD